MDQDNALAQLASHLGQQLNAARWQLTTAESCTGGLVAATITALAGSSHWFDRGFVTYSIQSKIEMLGVAAELIERHGAVSEPVARAMAAGALRHSAAQLALAVTGIAGPTHGGEDKPVGTVCFAWSHAQKTHCETQHFKGNRQQIRRQAVEHALRGVLGLLEGVV